MRPNQSELDRFLGLKDRRGHSLMQGDDAGKGPQRGDALGNPGRMLEYRGEGSDEILRGNRIEPLEGNHGDTGATLPVPGSMGWVAIQCRAISTRRQTHTCSCART